jgi:NCS1 family nucleobase:cation symporter-1
MGAIGGILICDYWVIRRQTLSLRELYLSEGRYSYTSGINWRAVAAFVIAIMPVMPGFIRAASTEGGAVSNPTFFDSLYIYSWFVTFGLAFVIYLALMWDRRGQD